MSNLQTNLKEAIFSVMEQMFFFLPDEKPADGETDMPVYIGISGEPSYLITLNFDRSLAILMATNLLGLDESELDNETTGKNLLEAANIIAGRFLLTFESSENRNVTLPSLDKTAVFPGKNLADGIDLTVSYDGCPLKACIETTV